MNNSKFPPGWDEARVREILAHFDDQSDDEQFAEIESARDSADMEYMAIPLDLVPEVRALLARGHGV